MTHTETSRPQAGSWHGEGTAYQYRSLPSSPKYTVTEVLGSRSHTVIKRATSNQGQHDLGNAVAWTQAIGSRRPQTFDVPITHSQAFKDVFGDFHVGSAAVFEWIKGEKPAEAALKELVEPVADIVCELGRMTVPWEGDAKAWLRNRREGKVGQALAQLPDTGLAHALEELLSDSSIDVVEPGVTHGDLKPDNMLIRPNGRIVLLDGEFGTHDRRPEYAVPRALDAGYFFHMLHTQHQQPDTADIFYKHLADRLVEDPTWEQEFRISVAERSLSMYTNFVLRATDDPGIDPRRQDPANYLPALAAIV